MSGISSEFPQFARMLDRALNFLRICWILRRIDSTNCSSIQSHSLSVIPAGANSRLCVTSSALTLLGLTEKGQKFGASVTIVRFVEAAGRSGD